MKVQYAACSIPGAEENGQSVGRAYSHTSDDEGAGMS